MVERFTDELRTVWLVGRDGVLDAQFLDSTKTGHPAPDSDAGLSQDATAASCDDDNGRSRPLLSGNPVRQTITISSLPERTEWRCAKRSQWQSVRAPSGPHGFPNEPNGVARNEASGNLYGLPAVHTGSRTNRMAWRETKPVAICAGFPAVTRFPNEPNGVARNEASGICMAFQRSTRVPRTNEWRGAKRSSGNLYGLPAVHTGSRTNEWGGANEASGKL